MSAGDGNLKMVAWLIGNCLSMIDWSGVIAKEQLAWFCPVKLENV